MDAEADIIREMGGPNIAIPTPVTMEEARQIVFTTGEVAKLWTVSQQTAIRYFDKHKIELGFTVPGSTFRRYQADAVLKMILETGLDRTEFDELARRKLLKINPVDLSHYGIHDSVTPAEAAKILRIGLNAVFKLMGVGDLPAWNVPASRERRINLTVLRIFAAQANIRSEALDRLFTPKNALLFGTKKTSDKINPHLPQNGNGKGHSLLAAHNLLQAGMFLRAENVAGVVITPDALSTHQNLGHIVHEVRGYMGSIPIVLTGEGDTELSVMMARAAELNGLWNGGEGVDTSNPAVAARKIAETMKWAA